MYNRALFLLFLLLSLNIFANEIEIPVSSSLASTEGMINSIVSDHVCVITGDFIDSGMDLIVPGPEPLAVRRTYSSSDMFNDSFFRMGWKLTEPDILVAQLADGGTVASAKTAHGARVKYAGYVSRNATFPVKFNLRYMPGITNCRSAEISGRTNLKNNKLSINKTPYYFTAILNDSMGYEKKYAIPIHSDIVLHFKLYEEISNHGTLKLFEYGENTLSVSTNNKNKSLRYGTLNYKGDKKSIQVNSSTNDNVKFTFEKFSYRKNGEKTSGDFLSEVVSSQNLPRKYGYVRNSIDHPTICSVDINNHRKIEVEYYEKGKNQVGDRIVDKKNSALCLDRVKLIKKRTPIGDIEISHRFFYHLESTSNKGWTEVLDAHNNRIDYFYNNDQRLEYIINHHNGNRYVRETFTWGLNGSPDEGNLAGKYIQEEGGPYQSGKVFYYDSKGNITSLREYNFVNGHQGPDLSINQNGKPHPHNQAEYYLRTFNYDQNNLMLSEHEANGKNIYYTYVPNSDLVASKILVYGESQVLMREFYDYDENMFLYRKVIDDGSSLDRHNHQSVTCMRVINIKPRMSPPFGVPEQIDETYRDCKTGVEHLLHRTINHHQPNGHLVKQDHYDSLGQKLYTLEWEYNAHGKLTKEIDALGNVIVKQYDDQDRLICQKGPATDFHVTFSYDEADQVIERTEHHSDGRFTIRNRYDRLGNITSIIDVRDNETIFTYDDLNRVTKISYPDSTMEEFDYDIFGNKTRVLDRNGYETKTVFNSLGKPLKIDHPDGTQERFEYWQEGTLKKAVAKDGTYIVYNRDCMDRVREEIRYDANHDILSKRCFIRNSFNLLEEIDAEGNSTHFEYDAAARLIKKYDAYQTITFEYDTCNRIHKEIHWINDREASVTVYLYDHTNRIVEERTEDLSGNVFSVTKTTFNVHGKKTSIVFGNQVTRTVFNSHQDPVILIDAEGNETRFEYEYHYVNSKDQNVTSLTIYDPMGNKTVKIHDLNGFVASESQYNAFNKLLSYSERTYDSKGKLLFEKNKKVVDGNEKQVISTRWVYNTNGELLSLIEAVGTKDQRARTCKYNCLAQKVEQIKPDGIVLYYAYDPCGRLQHIYSSDQTIDYTYTYNRNDQLISVYDAVLNSQTSRTYDGERLLSEILGNGLSIQYEYDNLNRRIKTTLPDKSTIDYQYDSAHLREITRNNYKHIYKQYDENGDVTESVLPFKCGSLKFQYDSLSRKRKIIHPAYTETIPKKGYDKAGNLLQYTIKGGCTRNFVYDDLYQLISEEGNENHTYSYDSLNNRLRKDDETSNYNALNELKGKGLEYDLNGNLIKNDALTFSYDALNRLIKVVTPEGTYSYTYDFDNRRLSKNDELFLYDNQNHIAVYEKNKPKVVRILGDTRNAEIGAAVALEIKGNTLIPLHDHNGSVATLLNPDGSVNRQYTYTAFGEQVESGEIDTNPWRYSSKYLDEETKFIYFGRRYYDPSFGRWVTPDPADYEDGPNLYCYVRNRPLTCIDLYGLWCTEYIESIFSNVGQFFARTTSFWDSFERYGIKSTLQSVGLVKHLYLGIGYINGMATTIEKNLETADMIADMFGYQVSSVHNSTHGLGTDVFECALGSFGIATSPVRLLHEQWDDFFANNKDANFLQICHSQGAIHVANALASYDPELRKRILVLAIAPGGYINSEHCGQVKHYRSTRDFVPCLDIRGLIRETNRGTVYTLKPARGAQVWDHGIDSPSYREIILNTIRLYERTGGKEI